MADPVLLEADKDAEYTAVIDIDLEDIKEPILALPNDPDASALLSEVQGNNNSNGPLYLRNNARVVVQDLDKPQVWGSLWGEVAAGIHRALGCVGAIVDGGVRDLEDMRAAGFKTLAQRLCVGHAWATPVRWGGEVEVFGTVIRPGQLIHADHHGFIAIADLDSEDGTFHSDFLVIRFR